MRVEKPVKRRVRKSPKKLPDEDMPMTNKRQLVALFAKEVECSFTDAEWLVETLLEVMARQIVRGRGLRVTGFGQFTVEKREAHEARNPQNGQPVQVNAMNIPKFKPGQRLLDVMNGDLKLRSGERIVGKKPKTYKDAPETA